MTSIQDQAIQAALDSNWKLAVKLNTQLLVGDSENTDVLNRLSYAQAQLGDYKKACANYNKILTIDPYNHIAKKNLEKFKKIEADCASGHSAPQAQAHVDPDMFVADAEKTRIVQLVKIAPKTTLSALAMGERLTPVRKGYDLQLKTEQETYVGTLPDDIGRKFIKFEDITPPECYVKDIQDNEVSVFVKWHR